MSNSAKKSGAEQFRSFFDANVSKEAQEVEKKRKTYFTLAVVLSCVGLPISFISLFINPIFSVIILGGVVILPVLSLRSLYGFYAKKSILPKLLGFWGDYQYTARKEPPYMYILNCLKKQTPIIDAIKGYFSYEYPRNFDFNALRRLIDFSSVEIDDCISGKYNDVDMEVCELFAYTTSTDKDGRIHKNYSFKGVVLAANIKKPFKGITSITRDKFKNPRLLHPQISGMPLDAENLTRAINEVTQVVTLIQERQEEIKEKVKNPDPSSEENLKRNTAQKVNLEDPEFAKRFNTFSNDQIEARYLLTTAFMNRFLSMAMQYNYKVKAVFADNRLYVMIETYNKNWFEIPFFKSAVDMKNYKTILSEFSGLLGVIDALKLEQNIGM